MPFALHSGVRLFWRLEGANDRPAVILLNSIGTDISLWDATVPHLIGAFRVVRLDSRGHGASDAPEGDYTLSTLSDDVIAVMDAAGIDQAAIAGVSLGGMVAMELALRYPQRVLAVALICTSATMDRKVWDERVTTVRSQGMAAISETAMGRFLSPEFMQTHPEIAESVRRGLVATSVAGYAGSGAAIRDMALLERLPTIHQPTLVVAGNRDISTPFAGHGEHLVAAIPSAKVALLNTAHLAPLEAPASLASLLREFLLARAPVEDAADLLFEAGLVNRRRVLGDEWVNRSLGNRTSFDAEFQAMITRIAWHEIWGRFGLDDRTRRLIVLAITASLGRWEEFSLHVGAGIERVGFTVDELKELLMQIAIYAGVPAANTAFAEARKILGKTLDVQQ